jgi:hypothetical protein
MDSSIPRLFDCDLEQLRFRLSELDSYAQALEQGAPDIDFIYASVFSRGGTEEDDWNNYHRVRNEYDRRAAEEFDLGQ